jgi:hypothetical protein|tara:strand:- start:5196 stop:5990 length:795 start_codon:yes stop_codon:yes gene_type:complete
MKLDRVVFALNSNPLYSGMWNIVSEVYSKKTPLIPTLLFVGTQEELEKEVNFNFGEVYLLPKHEEFISNPSLDWTVTWCLYWGIANLFPNDFCLTSGMDEIPLSSVLWDRIEPIDDSKFVVGLGPHPYGPEKLIGSGQNSGKGSTFKKLFNIDNDLHDELHKVWSIKTQLPRASSIGKGNNWWGLDEDYISTFVFDSPDVYFLEEAWVSENLQSKKICRSRDGFGYNAELINNGFYWTAHMVRPLSDPNNQALIDKLLKDIRIR